jgi:transcriptional regulator with XRE-family HTH domain
VPLGILSYNVGVNPGELWREVGRVLRDAREARKMNPSQVAKRSGIDAKTIQSIEAGEAGNVEKLQLHADAFGLSIVDVLATVLERTKTPLSPEAGTLLRQFESLNVVNRRILVELAQSLHELEARLAEK